MNQKNSALFPFKLACEKTFSGAVSDFFHSGPQISSIPDQIQLCPRLRPPAALLINSGKHQATGGFGGNTKGSENRKSI